MLIQLTIHETRQTSNTVQVNFLLFWISAPYNKCHVSIEAMSSFNDLKEGKATPARQYCPARSSQFYYFCKPIGQRLKTELWTFSDGLCSAPAAGFSHLGTEKPEADAYFSREQRNSRILRFRRNCQTEKLLYGKLRTFSIICAWQLTVVKSRTILLHSLWTTATYICW